MNVWEHPDKIHLIGSLQIFIIAVLLTLNFYIIPAMNTTLANLTFWKAGKPE